MTVNLDCYTVSGLNMLIKSIIGGVPVLRGIWVRGELSGFVHHSSGHMYFTLKDAQSRLKCVMFHKANRTVRFHPEDGLEVLAFGTVDVYERGGEYQLYVEMLEPAGFGALYLAFIQLRDRLAREGLFDPARKRPLPPYPTKIALITSPTGAAVRDMIKILRQRQPALSILVIPALVQGKEAAPSLVAALEAASRQNVDLVILGRGGGSPEELWPFNEEMVARAIVACRHPVISAVGHETDVTIADFAADARAATPSAAAEMAVPDSMALRRNLAGLSYRLLAAARRKLTLERSRLARLAASAALAGPGRLLSGPRQRLDGARQELEKAGRRALAYARRDLLSVTARLDAVSPLATLSRGYAVCLTAGGRILRSASDVEPEDMVRVVLHRGRLVCRVQQKEEDYG